MFYTRSNGVLVPARVVGIALEGFIHLEYFQDAVQDRVNLLRHPKFQFTSSLLTQPSISIWWEVVWVVTGKLIYHWTLCSRCACARQKCPLGPCCKGLQALECTAF